MESQYIIRKAKLEDIPRLSGLLEILFSVEADFTADESKQRKGLEMMLNDPENRCILVAESNQGVIGMCTAQILVSTAEGGPVALIEDVIVDKQFRRWGIGQKLLLAIEDWALERGARRLQLLADQNNTPALEFYKRMSWNKTQLICLHKK